MFPWNDPLPTDAVGQKLPRQQQQARMSQFNAAASIESAIKKQMMDDLAKEQEYQQQKASFLKYKQAKEQQARAAPTNSSSTQQPLPSNVQVDWAGFVVPPNQRKTYHNHSSQRQNTKQENGYIVPQAENVSSGSSASSSSIHFSTSSHNSKKHFENDQRFQTWDKSGQQNPHRSATYQQGPGTSHGTSHWQTSTQALYKGEQVGDGRGFLPADKVGCRKKFKPAFEQASSQRMSIHQQPLRELGQQSIAQHHHQHGSMSSGAMEPRVDMSSAGGAGMRSRQGQMLSGAALSRLAGSVAKSVARPDAVLKPTVNAFDKLGHSMNVHHDQLNHMPGTTVTQRRRGLW